MGGRNATRATAAAGVAAAVLGAWSLHNLWLLPRELARWPGGALDVPLLLARVAVWMAPVGLFLWRFEPDGRSAAAAVGLTAPRPLARSAVGVLPALAYLAVMTAGVGPGTDAIARLGSPRALLVLVGGAFLEEVLIRGFVYGELVRAGARAWWAVPATAALFAALHVPGWVGAGMPAIEMVPSLVVLFALGAVLATSRATSGSIAFALAIHAANNLLG